tara:strand:- start:1959 stop:2453 length:495 start_codon:yes stop_codon:yes gene_type:complete
MWTLIKYDQKNLNFFKNNLNKLLGKNCEFYFPKYLLKKKLKNKVFGKEINLLGDYIFCYNEYFSKRENILKLNNTKGLKYFLKGYQESQKEIEVFISKCKKNENEHGYLEKIITEVNLNLDYKFKSGPFSEEIFKIIKFNKNKINIMLGNIKASFKNNYLYNQA